MTTWTPATSQTETWTEETQTTRVFSLRVFSHAIHTGKKVFAVGSSAGIWDERAKQSEAWVAA